MFTPNYHDGVIKSLITDIPETDFDVSKGGQVEIIGWLYQYYNTEPHDYAVNITGGPVTKNEIPAATQLFTTDWVVRYMVDNSLGKYWLERHPESKLASSLKFLLPGKQEFVNSNEKIDEMKFIDNAMGSGHILIYAFDVFMSMYQEEGYSTRDAAKLIVNHNIYGLEIDKRAYQLAYFSIMMKARQYNRRALQNGQFKPNLSVFEDTTAVTSEFLSALEPSVQEDIQELVEVFSNARELGSIIKLQHEYDWETLQRCVSRVETDDLDVFGIERSKLLILRMLRIAQMLTQKYDVVVTNPPYLNKYDAFLKKYVKKYYTDYSGDLFSVFIYNNINWVKPGGYSAYMTPFVWMFIKTYEKLRTYIVQNKQISSLIQMEYSAFEEATVPINTFVLKNTPNTENGIYIKLSDFKGGMDVQKDRVLDAISDPAIDYLYRTNQANFEKIPGSPIAYWANIKLANIYKEYPQVNTQAAVKKGSFTGDNNKFLRLWPEVSFDNIGINMHSTAESIRSNKRWFPYNKGGKYRKWFGNRNYVINWFHDAEDLKESPKFGLRNPQYIFKKGITWSSLSSGSPSFRYSENGFIFDSKGPMIFTKEINYLMGFLNSKIAEYILNILSPTLDYNPTAIKSLPLVEDKSEVIQKKVTFLIELSRSDYNTLEWSWNFTKHPLLLHIADDKLLIWYYSLVQTNISAKNVPIFQLWGLK